MGLRIDSNRLLAAFRNRQLDSLDNFSDQQRIFSDLQIDSTSDSRSGIVLSGNLREQLEGVNQTVRATERNNSILNTVDTALSEISDQISNIRQSVSKVVNSSVSNNEQNALQQTVNQSLSFIRQLADTTSFGDTPLLNGQLAFTTTSKSDQIQQARIHSTTARNLPETVNVQIISPASEAEATGEIAEEQSQSSKVQIAGEKGSATLEFDAGASRYQVEEVINEVTDQTGVKAEDGNIVSTRVGSQAEVSVEEISGNLEGIAEGSNYGTDIEGNIEGVEAEGNRNVLRVSGTDISGEVQFSKDIEAGAFQFTIEDGNFELGALLPQSEAPLRFALESVEPSQLGGPESDQSLATLQSGGEHSLSQNPDTALRIARRAEQQIQTFQEDVNNIKNQAFEATKDRINETLQPPSLRRLRDGGRAEQAARTFRATILDQSSLELFEGLTSDLNQAGALQLLSG